MKYNKDNLAVVANIISLENELQDLMEDITSFKTSMCSKFNNLNIDYDEDISLLEAIDNLKQLNLLDAEYGSIYDGEVYDLEDESINDNEIKVVALVKPGQTIRFSLGLTSYIKPSNQFTTGANQFITVDWGDGVTTQGYSYFSHVYENMTDSFKPFNKEYKQVIITVKPSCYLENEDILMPSRITFDSVCTRLILGINVNFVGISSKYYNVSYPSIDLQNYRNLRYYYTTEAYIQAYNFRYDYRLERIKANTLYLNSNSQYTFQDCWSLTTIDADIIVDKAYDTTYRDYMFYNCYNLESIKSLDFGTVNTTAGYTQLFYNCFKLQEVPLLKIDCNIANSAGCQFFENCRSLSNPFQYLEKIKMLKNANALFCGCWKIVECPEELDLSLATQTQYLFNNCVNMEIAPQKLYLDVTTNCSYMFNGCHSLQRTPSIITAPKCTNVNYMFNKCYTLKNVSCNLDFADVQNNFSYMFADCYSLESFDCNIVKLGSNNAPLGHLDASKYLFPNCINLKKLPKQEFSIRYMDCSSTSYINWSLEECSEVMNFTISTALTNRIKSMSHIKKMPREININSTTGAYLFADCYNLKEINDLTINLPNATDINSMFRYNHSLTSITNLTINAPQCTNINYLFDGCRNLKTVENVKINLKPNSAITMHSLFYGCVQLEQIPNLGFDYEDCASVMQQAFYSSGITQAIFNKPFKKLNSLYQTFYSCRRLEKAKLILETDINFTQCWDWTPELRDIDFNLNLSNRSNNPFYGLPSSPSLTVFKVDFNKKEINNNSGFTINWYSFLHCIELRNYANSSNINLDNNPRLQKVIITFKENVSANIYMRSGKLSAEALNDFFTNLPSVSGKTIFLKGQANIDLCDKTIATRKGWTINTTT